MLPKNDFFRVVQQRGPLPAEALAEIDEQYESAAEAAVQLAKAMPSIGLLSVAKRLNAFFAVCRHIDQLVEADQISASQGQLSILILRLADSSFKKAAIMFDMRAGRFDAAARAEMPRSARLYLANLIASP